MHQLVFRQSFNPPQFCADGSLNPKHKHKSGFSCVFINDIVVLSKKAAEHKQHLQAVLSELRDHKLLIKASKCVWGQTGRLIWVTSSAKMAPYPKKVQCLVDWLHPTCLRKVLQFLGH